MVILPKMVGILMEGIMPLTSSIREFMQKRFKGREIRVSLDHATLMGHPSVIASSLIAMPLFVILSAVLPGSGIVATASVAAIPWWISAFAAQTKGNIFKMVLMMLIWSVPAILIATWAAPGLTAACARFGIASDAIAAGQTVGTLTPSDPLTGLMYWVATMFAAK
jgi:PTS system galactitol-specific IIC component